ncbi:MAG: protein-export chaperone SecB [Gammaproteobacteria bacterium]|nr:protein-export chaperone SecB [Gammaproteobacteria bacterium]
MADKKTTPTDKNKGAVSTDEQDPRNIQVKKIYTKDTSYEAPLTPAIFADTWEPKIDLNITTAVKAAGEDSHEVSLKITAEAKLIDKTAFIAEVEQAGVFSITGFDKEEFSRIVGSYCPNILFPYARQTIGDLISKGGFPQLILQPINFDSLYQQHLQEFNKAQVEATQIETKH